MLYRSVLESEEIKTPLPPVILPPAEAIALLEKISVLMPAETLTFAEPAMLTPSSHTSSFVSASTLTLPVALTVLFWTFACRSLLKEMTRMVPPTPTPADADTDPAQFTRVVSSNASTATCPILAVAAALSESVPYPAIRDADFTIAFIVFLTTSVLTIPFAAAEPSETPTPRDAAMIVSLPSAPT